MIEQAYNIGDTEARSEYYTLAEAAAAMGVGVRHAKRLLGGAPQSLTRCDIQAGRGRPRTLYHFSAHPRLWAAWSRAGREKRSTFREIPSAAPIHQDDLTLARIRAMAVEEYLALRESGMSEAQAAAHTVAAWRSPHTETVRHDERIGRRIIRHTKEVSVGGFSIRTLRTWASIYKDSGKVISALAPARKKSAGRRKKEIPDAVLDFVHAVAVANPRADIKKAVELAEKQYGGDWPSVSYKTILRRLRERDPERFCDTLGKRGVQEFRAKHSPDITVDYSDLRYNQLWQLDDVTEDFYGHMSDPVRLVRPYVYAVMRVSTRQWIHAVACETPITQDQVRTLVGLGMADKAGGIPEEITFERGAVACDDYLQDLLEKLGVKVHRTSMDGGRAHPAFLPDRGKGHFQGKGVIESNFRRHHNLQWDASAQTGPDERHTAQARLETLKAEAVKRAKNGDFLILPTPAQWQARIFAAREEHNRKPHTGLPRIVDPDTGARRNMTPNEYARAMRKQEIRVMDERLLPLFFKRGLRVPVTKNGLKLNGEWYGKWDEDLQEYAGKTVMAYGIADMPQAVYVIELARCVDRAEAHRYGADDDAVGRKRRVERRKRNLYERMISRAVEEQGTVTADTVKFTANPVPDRALTICAPDDLLNRAAEIRAGVRKVSRRASARAERFDIDEKPNCVKQKRRGLLDKAGELEDQLAVLLDGGITPEDKFEL